VAHEILAAIESGDVDRARELVRQDPSAASERDEDGVSAPLLGLYHGQAELADQLADARPELDVFEAAAFGRADRLRALLDEDASRANAWAEDGFQPLGLACFFGRPEAARLLIERGADVNSQARNERIQSMPLHAAAAAGDAGTRYELAKLLLEHGADPNARQGTGETALEEADQHGDERLRELLVAHGATAA
jgi:ankyrin repeat protein